MYQIILCAINSAIKYGSEYSQLFRQAPQSHTLPVHATAENTSIRKEYLITKRTLQKPVHTFHVESPTTITSCWAQAIQEGIQQIITILKQTESNAGHPYLITDNHISLGVFSCGLICSISSLWVTDANHLHSAHFTKQLLHALNRMIFWKILSYNSACLLNTNKCKQAQYYEHLFLTRRPD